MSISIRFTISLTAITYLTIKALIERDYLLGLINIIQLIGCLFNLTVILVNDRKMPVLIDKNEELVKSSAHIPMSDSTKLPLLADRYKLSGFRFSIGDLYIITGISLFLLYAGTILLRL